MSSRPPVNLSSPWGSRLEPVSAGTNRNRGVCSSEHSLNRTPCSKNAPHWSAFWKTSLSYWHVRRIGSVEAAERRTQSVLLCALRGAARHNCQEMFNLARGFSPFSPSLFHRGFCSTGAGRECAVMVKTCHWLQPRLTRAFTCDQQQDETTVTVFGWASN